MSNHVFISYATEDEATASRICQLLEDSGITCWIASRDMIGGTQPTWPAEIVAAIERSDALLVVLSAASNHSRQVAREVELADNKGLSLFPVRIEEIEPAGDLDFFLRNAPWLNAFSGSLEFHAPQIIEGVRARLGMPKIRRQSGLAEWLKAHWGKLGAGAIAAVALAVAPWPCWRDYRVRVSVLDPQKRPMEEATVTDSRGELRKTPAGWETDVPRASRPADGRLVINASSPDGSLRGSTEVRLGRNCATAASIQLQPEPMATVRGMVQTIALMRVAGARVSVLGYESEAVTTGAGGEFELPAHGPAGTPVVLHVEKDGFPPIDQQHFAGPDPATVTLTR